MNYHKTAFGFAVTLPNIVSDIRDLRTVDGYNGPAKYRVITFHNCKIVDVIDVDTIRIANWFARRALRCELKDNFAAKI